MNPIRPKYQAEMESPEDSDHYLNESFDEADDGVLDDGGDSSEENAEEVIDYEEMKRALESFQNVGVLWDLLVMCISELTPCSLTL